MEISASASGVAAPVSIAMGAADARDNSLAVMDTRSEIQGGNSSCWCLLPFSFSLLLEIPCVRTIERRGSILLRATASVFGVITAPPTMSHHVYNKHAERSSTQGGTISRD